jgi:hypothetical protein
MYDDCISLEVCKTIVIDSMFILIFDENSILSIRGFLVLNEIDILIFCDYRNDSYAMICFDIKSRG